MYERKSKSNFQRRHEKKTANFSLLLEGCNWCDLFICFYAPIGKHGNHVGCKSL